MNYKLVNKSLIIFALFGTFLFPLEHFIINENGFNYQAIQIIIDEFEGNSTKNISAWMDNPETDEVDGFIVGRPIMLKFWSSSLNEEFWIDDFEVYSGTGLFYPDEIALIKINQYFSYGDEIAVVCDISNENDNSQFLPVGAISLDTELQYGDINFDYLINVTDILIIVQQIMGEIILSNEERVYADVNFDGIINVNDIIVILYWILGF